MYAPDDPFAVRRPAPAAERPAAEPAIDAAVPETATAFEPEPVNEDTAPPEPRATAEPEAAVESGTAVESESWEPEASEPESFEPDIGLLDRAEATFGGAAQVIELVDAGDLDQAESLLDSLVGPSSE